MPEKKIETRPVQIKTQTPKLEVKGGVPKMTKPPARPTKSGQ